MYGSARPYGSSHTEAIVSDDPESITELTTRKFVVVGEGQVRG